MEAVAGSLLSALVGMVIKRLGPHAKEKLVSMWGMQPELEKLEMTLLKVKDMLADAERRDIQGESFLKAWLAKLRDVAYDVDDVLDEMYLKRLKDEAKGHHQVSKIKSPFRRIKYSPKIQKLQSRVDGIVAEAGSYELKKLTNLVKQAESAGTEGRETSSISDGELIGRDDVKAQVVELLQSAPQDECFVVYTIIGHGGVGKTTLAQFVFNDENIRNHFDLKIWLCVSEDCNKKRLTVEIIKSISSESRGTGRSEPCVADSWDMLQNRLKDELTGKRFLLVLDDVWNEEPVLWQDFMKPFRFAGNGSKILVTARSREVAKAMSSIQLVQLKGLSDDHFSRLFSRFAFGNSSSSTNQSLEKIGKEIEKKLKGSPLAAKTVGCLLHSDLSIEHWNNIFRSNIRELPQSPDDIMPVLRLSYQYLPQHLKPCFAFLSLFPKDYVFDGKELVWMWVAHGFIQAHENGLPETIGMNYLNGLLGRCMIQHDRHGYKMHDLIHDLAQMISADEYFSIKLDSDIEKVPKTVRHLSIFTGQLTLHKVKQLQNLENMRTLLFFRSVTYGRFEGDLQQVYMKAKQLRLLDVRFYALKELPSSIGELKHLRYLDMSGTNITKLPPSLCSLYNLMVLILEFCSSRTNLPKGMNKLRNLRHLILDDYFNINFNEVRSLSMLQELNFNTFDITDRSISGLRDMSELQKLHIRGLAIVRSKEDAIQARLVEKNYLKDLELSWGCCDRNNSSCNNDEQVLEGLQPGQSIKRLCIVGYRGFQFPSWMNDLSFSCLQNIDLCFCGNIEILPPLGQLQHLKSLSITGMDAVKEVGPEFYGEGESKGFPSLEVLRVTCMPELDSWGNVTDGTQLFPRLSVLIIKICPKLKKLPPWVPSVLTELRLNDCEALLASSLQPEGSFNLPSTLTCLEIRSCGDLGNSFSSTQLGSLTSLGVLDIKHCHNIEMIPRKVLESLIDLSIDHCQGMNPDLGVGGNHITSLESLAVKGLANITTLTRDVLQHLPSLRILSVQDCEELVTLEVEALPSLTQLRIEDCPKLCRGSLLQDSPSRLASVHVARMSMRQMKEWLLLLHTIPSVLRISIDGCSELTFFDNELETALLNFKSLSSLEISSCGNLESLPTCLNNLSSLHMLDIHACPKIQSFPENGLPSSLESLSVSLCPILEKQCERNAGPYWRKISHISNVEIRD